MILRLITLNLIFFISALEAYSASTAKVEAGDTIQELAQKLYGSSCYWPEIVARNPKILRTPTSLAPGSEIEYDRRQIVTNEARQCSLRSTTRSAKTFSTSTQRRRAPASLPMETRTEKMERRSPNRVDRRLQKTTATQLKPIDILAPRYELIFPEGVR
jgi:hypothetical protein